MTTTAYISDATGTVILYGEPSPDNLPRLVMLTEYVDGWYSSPDLKVTQTERQTGDGAFPVDDSVILYSARTVTCKLVAFGRSRDELLAQINSLNRMMGKNIAFRLQDDSADTEVNGYGDVKWDTGRYETYMTGTLTIVCPDPRRYASQGNSVILDFSENGTVNALQYDAKTAGLKFPISFSADKKILTPNSCTLTNNGNAVAYPVIGIAGSVYDVVFTDTGTGKTLEYGSYIGTTAVIIDCLAHTALCNDVDMTSNIISHNFPSIPPNGSITLNMTGTGVGIAEILFYDTYI